LEEGEAITSISLNDRYSKEQIRGNICAAVAFWKYGIVKINPLRTLK